MVPENFRSYEQRRAVDPIKTVLEDVMSETAEPWKMPGATIGKCDPLDMVSLENGYLGLPPSVKIRMKALECATRMFVGKMEDRGSTVAFDSCLADFEDYIKNGRA